MSNRGINKVILVGNLGDDPETKYTQGGTAVTTCRIATSSERKDRDGNRQTFTEWHRVKFFGKLAEIAGEYLRKGSQVYVEGSIRYSQSEHEGQKRHYTDIVADEMQMLGGKGEPATRGDSAPPRRREPPKREAPAKSSSFNDDFEDDDLPF